MRQGAKINSVTMQIELLFPNPLCTSSFFFAFGRVWGAIGLKLLENTTIAEYHEGMIVPRAHILHFPKSDLNRPPAVGEGIRLRMRPWGVTITDIAMEMGVSRQYIWQILYDKTPISEKKAGEVAALVDILIQRLKSGSTLGERLRRARIGAALTLKEVASQIGYSWVAVERWEKNQCLPKPGVLFHLQHVYNVGEDWLPTSQSSNAPTQAM
jgi:transcriptional regulator with XRE-family HTH domain